MPVWYEKTREWVAAGKLVVVGITQEQHSDRCRLFAQWKGIDWPILWDPINLTGSSAVPIVTAIDEYGIVRSLRPKPETIEAEFLSVVYEPPVVGVETEKGALTPPVPEAGQLAAWYARAKEQRSPREWREVADAAVLWGTEPDLSLPIEAYRQVVAQDPQDAEAWFRLGVAYRARYDSPDRQVGDFQRAVQAWEQALSLQPNQYIWRRRIQQFGPRLEKPYPFYDWVETAHNDLVRRGETPIALQVVPRGSELASPSRRFVEESKSVAEPDPEHRIQNDASRLISAEVTCVPSQVPAGGTAIVHLEWSPDPTKQAHWNNEAEPLMIWVQCPAGWKISEAYHVVQPVESNGKATSNEIRRLDFEVQVPAGSSGRLRLPLYALYNVCDDAGGTCQYLRQDLEVFVEIQE